MTLADPDMQAAIAATRFGLGARPGEIAEARRDPQGFLRAQIRREGADQPPGAAEATSAQRLAEFREYRQERRAVRLEKAAMPAEDGGSSARDPVKVVGNMLRQDVGRDFAARTQLAVTTEAGFRERWANFWANHFTVSATKAITGTIVGPFETEAVRPHVFGRFADLLGAVETHPAMLTYLDQVQSIGPDSPAADYLKAGGGVRGAGAPRLMAVANRTVGLNENLAREILELHTVGVDGGYTQADVTEFARAMTGLSIGGPRDPDQGAGVAVFRPQAHEPGERTVMGVRYRAGGKEQAGAILADLAARPATARFICTKIARHFVADEPSAALVARLETAWRSSGGDLARVAEALIAAPEAWAPTQAKFKTPYEFIVSSYRAAGAQPESVAKIAPILTALGQKPFSAPSPKGWPEDAQSWAAPDAIVKRMQFAQAFSAAAVHDRDPKALAADALGARLTPDTAKAVARAESRAEGLALLLMSPEFQRR
ncbi:MAG: hypothetical protein JWQ29_2621 [Phenylobacterium sp.]|nr:hypothetical protein [Phenylobacterium sp.]